MARPGSCDDATAGGAVRAAAPGRRAAPTEGQGHLGGRGRRALRALRERPLSGRAAVPPSQPADKRFSLAQTGVTRSLESAREEARKSALACGNCHAELEAKLVVLP